MSGNIRRRSVLLYNRLRIRGACKQTLSPFPLPSDRGKTFLPSSLSFRYERHAIDYSNSFVIGREFCNKRFAARLVSRLHTPPRCTLRNSITTFINCSKCLKCPMDFSTSGPTASPPCSFSHSRVVLRSFSRDSLDDFSPPPFSPPFLAGFRGWKKHLGDFLPRPRKESSRKCGLRSTIPF